MAGNTCGDGVFIGLSHPLYPKGRDTSVSKISWDLLHVRMRNSNQILLGDHNILGKIFTRSTTLLLLFLLLLLLLYIHTYMSLLELVKTQASTCIDNRVQ